MLSIGTTLTTVCLLVSAFATYQTLKISDIERLPDLPNIVDVADDQPQNWLVVGSDNRGEFAGNRTDTIMIVRVDPEDSHVDILSLQRDLWLPIAGTRGAERINSAYGDNESPWRLIDTIKLNFHIDIHHYVEIGFEMFKEIVEAVGGVPMFFERPFRDKNSGLSVTDLGCVTLDGDQALAFTRARHLEYNIAGKWISDPTSDLGRISRQQFFMRRMFSRARDMASNPKVLNDLVSAANSHVKLDSKVDLDQAGAMMRRFSSVDTSAIKTWTLPTEPMRTAGGADVLELVPEGTAPILNIFRGLDPNDADPRTASFTIVDGSGTPGQAAQVRDAYKAIGYRAETAGEAPSPLARTEVRYGSGAQALASQIERHLTAGGELVADPQRDAGEVVLVTGSDLTTVMRRPRPWVEPPTTPPPSTTATTGRGSRSTVTTATTEVPTHNTGDSVVGVVPPENPPDCG